MSTQHLPDCAIDTEATRRQFLLAREQLFAHAPADRIRSVRYTPWHRDD